MKEHSANFTSIGVALMLIGAVMFATKAIFIKLAYHYEVSSISLLALRMGFSLPFFLLIGYVKSRRDAARPPLSWRDRITIISLGLFGYYLASYLDFLGLQYLSAGMERLILFVYPTLVLLIGRILLKTPIKSIQWVATGITYLGIIVAFSTADFSMGSSFTLGAALVFGSALTYSFFVVGSGEFAPKLGSVRFTSLAMVAAALGVLAHATVSGAEIRQLAWPVYGYGFAIAIIATVIPAYLVTEGIRRVGAGNAAILGAVGPVATIILEYLVLDESLNTSQWLGAGLIISGVIIIGRSKDKKAPRKT
ncbi:MAG: DMT family transporter [Bacteroidota bacterium]